MSIMRGNVRRSRRKPDSEVRPSYAQHRRDVHNEELPLLSDGNINSIKEHSFGRSHGNSTTSRGTGMDRYSLPRWRDRCRILTPPIGRRNPQC